MNHPEHRPDDAVVEVHNAQATSPVVLVCEHASAHIPAGFDDLGLSGDALRSHVAWDRKLDLAVLRIDPGEKKLQALRLALWRRSDRKGSDAGTQRDCGCSRQQRP